jgi:hypothetical protein
MNQRCNRTVKGLQILLLGLTAGVARLPSCVGLDDSLADGVINEIERNIGLLKGQHHSSIWDALHIASDCSKELWECQGPGAIPDTENFHCFSICIAVDTGCQSCCLEGMCYQASKNDDGLGSCGPCLGGDNQECASAFTQA